MFHFYILFFTCETGGVVTVASPVFSDLVEVF